MREIDEIWELIFTTKDFNTTNVKHFISAKEIIEITGKQPRLVTKFDTVASQPNIFRDNGYFILPTRNGEYIVIRGKGHEALDFRSGSKPKILRSSIKFDLTIADLGISEMQHLDRCFNNGVFEELLGTTKLYLGTRGRKYTLPFYFFVGTERIETKSVQIEVDLGLESEDSVVLIEAKIGKPENFLIRQLFFPYKHFSQLTEKPIRNIFFTYDPAENTYNVKEYELDSNKYDSLILRDSVDFIIRKGRDLSLRELIEPENIIIEKDITPPQADDLTKVMEVVLLVANGFNSAIDIAEKLQFDPRQSNYYVKAAENLDFLDGSFSPYRLTAVGRKYFYSNSEEREDLLIHQLSRFYIVNEILLEIDKKGCISDDEIVDLLLRNPHVKMISTARRRTLTMKSWLKWLANTTGAFKFDRNTFIKN